ncbi:MAG TPA: MerR family transcriptional regulator [Acidobacteriaceae bacterium]
MRIGQLATTAGVSVRALRHYEAKGLIGSVRRVNGYRDYGQSAVKAVKQIRLLISCGFSTRQIYGLLPCFQEDGKTYNAQNCAAGMEQYLAKRDELDQLIDVLKQRRKHLSDQIALFATPPIPSGIRKRANK